MLSQRQAATLEVLQAVAFDGVVPRDTEHSPIVHLACGHKPQRIQGSGPGDELNIKILGAQKLVDYVSFLHSHALSPQVLQIAHLVPTAGKYLAASHRMADGKIEIGGPLRGIKHAGHRMDFAVLQFAHHI